MSFEWIDVTEGKRLAQNDYTKLKEDTIYQVYDSLMEPHRFLFRGYQYDAEWYDDTLIFWDTERDMAIVHWPSGEFQYAIELTEA